MTYSWETHVTTCTPGEVVSFGAEDGLVVISSNLVKNEIRLTPEQAKDLVCGVASKWSEAREQ